MKPVHNAQGVDMTKPMQVVSRDFPTPAGPKHAHPSVHPSQCPACTAPAVTETGFDTLDRQARDEVIHPDSPYARALTAPAVTEPDLRAAVERWLTSQEYERMEAEGAVAAMLGYEWSEAGQGGWVRRAATPPAEPTDTR